MDSYVKIKNTSLTDNRIFSHIISNFRNKLMIITEVIRAQGIAHTG